MTLEAKIIKPRIEKFNHETILEKTDKNYLKLKKNYKKARPVLGMIARLMYDYEIKGKENCYKTKNLGGIIISNHVGTLDPFFISIGIKDKYIRWVSKKENFQGLQEKIIQPLGAIPLGYDKKLTKKALKDICQTLQNNDLVGIFPEGTRNKNKSQLEYKTGAARFCLENKVPYLPVGLVKEKKKFRTKIIVNIGELVFLDKYYYSYENLTMKEKKSLCKTIAREQKRKVNDLKNL